MLDYDVTWLLQNIPAVTGVLIYLFYWTALEASTTLLNIETVFFAVFMSRRVAVFLHRIKFDLKKMYRERCQ